jgi:hypothetical protein
LSETQRATTAAMKAADRAIEAESGIPAPA